MKRLFLPEADIQAILKGTKTMLRLPVKEDVTAFCDFDANEEESVFLDKKGDPVWVPFPYAVDSIVYVCEPWNECTIAAKYTDEILSHSFMYKLTDIDAAQYEYYPASRMPKEAARIFLKIKGVGVEQLQDAYYGDICREGVELSNLALFNERTVAKMYVDAYRLRWNSRIQPAKYKWDRNPFVWVYEFERCDKDGNVIQKRV